MKRGSVTLPADTPRLLKERDAMSIIAVASPEQDGWLFPREFCCIAIRPKSSSGGSQRNLRSESE